MWPRVSVPARSARRQRRPMHAMEAVIASGSVQPVSAIRPMPNDVNDLSGAGVVAESRASAANFAREALGQRRRESAPHAVGAETDEERAEEEQARIRR